MKHSQAEIEQHFYNQSSLVDKGMTTKDDAFGDAEEWLVELEDHKLILNPFFGQWFYFNPANQSWQQTGFGPGEALFFAWGKVLAYQQLPPQPDRKNDSQESHNYKWYIYFNEGMPSGPIAEAELSELLQSSRLTADTPIFNASMTEWHRVDELGLIKTDQGQPLACPKCRTACVAGDFFCYNCGFDLRSTPVCCSHCGCTLQPDDAFCPNCGNKITG